MEIDPYEVLSVSTQATDEEIRSAYRFLVHAYHPDKFQQLDGPMQSMAQEKLRLINEAYATLSDPLKRRAIDEARRRYSTKTAGGGPSDQGHTARQNAAQEAMAQESARPGGEAAGSARSEARGGNSGGYKESPTRGYEDTAAKASPPQIKTPYREWLYLGQGGVRAGQFASPKAVDVDTGGNIYVGDLENARIQKCSSRRYGRDAWKIFNSDCEHLQDLCIDNVDNVCVLQQGLLIRCPPRGGGEVIGFEGPVADFDDIDLLVDAARFVVDTHGNFYVALHEYGAAKWSPKGRKISVLLDANGGEMIDCTGITVRADGEILVSDSRNHCIHLISPRGSTRATFGKHGQNIGQLDSPQGLAVDREGNFYVADAGNHRIQQFTAEGDVIGVWGRPGLGAECLMSPADVAVDGDGNVYVADTGNHRIVVLLAPGHGDPDNSRAGKPRNPQSGFWSRLFHR